MLKRISRSTFLFRSIIIGVAQFIMYRRLLWLDTTIYSRDKIQEMDFMYVGIIILFIFSLTQVVMRLHDINKSGWLSLLVLVPIINIAGIALFFIDGDNGHNKYGEDPKKRNKESESESSPTKENYQLEKIKNLKDASFDNKFDLLKKAFESGIFSQLEYDNKKKQLEREKEYVKSEIHRLVNIQKSEDNLNEKKNRLTELKKEGLLTDHEYHQKMIDINESLNKLDS